MINIFVAVAVLGGAILADSVKQADLSPKDSIQSKLVSDELTSLDVHNPVLYVSFPEAGVVEAHSCMVAYIDDNGMRKPIDTKVQTEEKGGVTSWHVRTNTLRFDATSDGYVHYWFSSNVGVLLQLEKMSSTSEESVELDSVVAREPTITVPTEDGVRLSSVLGSGVTIDYKITSGAIKDIITIEKLPVIDNNAKTYSVIWRWTASELTPILADNVIRWEHAKYGELLCFDRPYVYDAKGSLLQSEYVLDAERLYISIDADALRKAEYPVYIDPSVNSDSATESATTYEDSYDIDDDGYYEAFALIPLPDLTGFTSIDSATLYLYAVQGATIGFDIYCDDTGAAAWNSSSNYSTLGGLSFNAATDSSSGATGTGWITYDVLGAIGTNGIAEIYDNDASPDNGATVKLTWTDETPTPDGAWPHEIKLDVESQPLTISSDTGSYPPYIRINYTTDVVQGAHPSGCAGVLHL